MLALRRVLTIASHSSGAFAPLMLALASNSRMNLNRAILIGRVTQDPQLRTTPSGQAVCNFSIATNRNWTDSETQERHEKAEFHNIVAWRRLAEIANQYLTKGSLVMIEGRIETRSWDDPSGNRRYRTEVIVENMQLGPRPMGGGRSQASATATTENTPSNSRQSAINNKTEEIPIVESDEPISGQTENLSSQDSHSDLAEEGEINVKNIPF